MRDKKIVMLKVKVLEIEQKIQTKLYIWETTQDDDLLNDIIRDMQKVKTLREFIDVYGN